MSDFLFRMVERAAGLATTSTPQPPRTFQWMAPVAFLPQYPATSARETQARPSAIESLPAVEDGNRHSVDVQSNLRPSVPEASSFVVENTISETSQPLPAVQSKPHLDVKAEIAKEAAPRFQRHPPENTEQTAHNVNVPQRQHRDLPAGAPPSKRQPLARHADGPIVADHETARFPLEKPAQSTSIHTVQPATPLPQESRTADVKTLKPASEPPVEVKIGRVEIHFDAPATPAPSPAPARPGGFAEYAELRRYASRKQ